MVQLKQRTIQFVVPFVGMALWGCGCSEEDASTSGAAEAVVPAEIVTTMESLELSSSTTANSNITEVTGKVTCGAGATSHDFNALFPKLKTVGGIECDAVSATMLHFGPITRIKGDLHLRALNLATLKFGTEVVVEGGVWFENLSTHTALDENHFDVTGFTSISAGAVSASTEDDTLKQKLNATSLHAGLKFSGNLGSLKTLNFTNLEKIGAGGGITFDSLNVVTTIKLPKLVTLDGKLEVSDLHALSSFSAAALTKVGAEVKISNVKADGAFDFSSLTSVATWTFEGPTYPTFTFPAATFTPTADSTVPTVDVLHVCSSSSVLKLTGENLFCDLYDPTAMLMCDNCASCKTGFNLTTNGAGLFPRVWCECPTGKYLDDATCEDCPADHPLIDHCDKYSCAVNGTAVDTTCGTCKDGFETRDDGATCVCNHGKYLDGATSTCEDCPAADTIDHCAVSSCALTGTDVDTCGECQHGFEPSSDGFTCVCPTGKYATQANTSTCEDCSATIENCEGYTCTTADNSACGFCKTGFAPTSDWKSCVADTTTDRILRQ